MICPKCGISNEEEARFCTVCGEQLTADSVPQGDPVPSIQPTEEAAQPAQTVPGDMPPIPPQPPVPPAYGQQPPMYGQPPYWQPPVPPQQEMEEPVSLGKWLGVMALEMFGGIIYTVLLFVWAFASSTNKNLKNYARARLIMTVIVIVLVVVLVVVFATVGMSLGAAVTDSYYAYPYM